MIRDRFYMSKRLANHLRRSGTRASVAVQLASQLPRSDAEQTIASVPPQQTYLSYNQEVFTDGVEAFFMFAEDATPYVEGIAPAILEEAGFPAGAPTMLGAYVGAVGLHTPGAIVTPTGAAYAVHFDAGTGAGLIDLTGFAGLDPYNFGPGDPFSVEIWVRTTQDPAAAVTIIAKGTTNWPYRLRLMPGGLIEASRRDAAAAQPSVTSPSVNDGTWHYVTFVRSGGILALQIDEDPAVATADTTVAATTNTDSVTIASDGYVGDVDDLGFYGRALTAGNRSRHIEAAAGGLVLV